MARLSQLASGVDACEGELHLQKAHQSSRHGGLQRGPSL